MLSATIQSKVVGVVNRNTQRNWSKLLHFTCLREAEVQVSYFNSILANSHSVLKWHFCPHTRCDPARPAACVKCKLVDKRELSDNNRLPSESHSWLRSVNNEPRGWWPRGCGVVRTISLLLSIHYYPSYLYSLHNMNYSLLSATHRRCFLFIVGVRECWQWEFLSELCSRHLVPG